MVTTKLFFLVAGYDYEGRGSRTGLAFGDMCTNRVRERISFINRHRGRPEAPVTENATLRFLRFSFEFGKVEVMDRAFDAANGISKTTVRESDWLPLSSVTVHDGFDPVKFVTARPLRAINFATDYDTSSDAHQPSLKQGAAADIMSITDVYHAIHDAPDNSVLELSFFSHGWVEGPVLVNSSDRVRNLLLRDPTDKDGRGSLDFNLTMGEPPSTPADLLRASRFMSRFDRKGFMQNWGCNFDVEVSLILQVNRALRRLEAQKTSVQDSTSIALRFERPKWTDRYRVVDPEPNPIFFPADTVDSFSRTFGDVKKFLRHRLARSYAFRFSASSGALTGFGALPGTSGDNDASGFRMMRVCAVLGRKGPSGKFLDCGDAYAPIFRFYKDRMNVGVQEGANNREEDRGYGIFDPATVQRITNEIAAEGAP